jgi:putative nucleotidyltransferase with HDIG domain
LLTGKTDINIDPVVDLIAYDPGLTAKLLQLCNSAAFAASAPTADLQEAVLRLGFRRICQIVAACSGARVFDLGKNGDNTEGADLWKHSVVTAMAASLIARDCGVDESLAFTAALLHDIGKVILAQALEKQYSQLVGEAAEQQQSLLEAEKRVLGVQHAEIGGRLLARWRFPAGVVAAVWFHHHPASAEPHHKLASCVYLGNLAAYVMGDGNGRNPLPLKARALALDILGVEGNALPGYMVQTYENYATIDAFIQMQ